MTSTITTATKNLNPKAPLIQGPRSLVKLLGACGSLHLSSLYLSLLSLLGALGLEIKNVLMNYDENAAPSCLLKIEDFVSSMALNAEGFKNTQSIFAYHQEVKQPFLPSDLEKQVEPRAGIDLGGSTPEAKARS